MDAALELRRGLGCRPAWAALLVATAVAATGCKSGTWGTKPSWWAFGQSGPGANDKLAAAPAFEGDVTKPSATAKPYPTTSTPQGYALDKSAPPAGAADPQAPVTYGSTPPPANLPQGGGGSSNPSAVGGASTIRPQVGPYAGAGGAGDPAGAVAAAPTATPAATPDSVPAWSPSPASATPAAAMAAATTPSGFGATPTEPPLTPLPSAAPGGSPPGSPGPRVADARAASPGWTGSGADVLPPSAADSRYAGGSRFSGGPAAAAPQGFPSAASPSTAVPAELQPPQSLPPMAPPSAPPAASPAAPMRRPDPGYRPGGTSSYRPSRTSIAAGPETGAVQPVSFTESGTVGE
jgi:hypothetical protein